jgi:hypothetical protein
MVFMVYDDKPGMSFYVGVGRVLLKDAKMVVRISMSLQSPYCLGTSAHTCLVDHCSSREIQRCTD